MAGRGSKTAASALRANILLSMRRSRSMLCCCLCCCLPTTADALARPTAFFQLSPSNNESEWMSSMMERVEGALVEAHELETELEFRPHSSSSDLIGSSLLREATIKQGMLPGARNQYRHHLLKLDMEASGCELVMLLDDAATLDTSHLCIWRDTDAEARPSNGIADAVADADTPMPNGEDAFARLRASRPAEQWLARDDAEAAFAAKYYDGSASEGFFPTRWQWLTAHPPRRRHAEMANATSGGGGSSSSSNASSSRSRSAASGGGDGGGNGDGGSERGAPNQGGGAQRPHPAESSPVLVLDGLAASKTYAVFRAGALSRGKRLFDDILAQQSRMIPGAVAAASLHDPVLHKLLWLVLWRNEKARDDGERLLAGVLNVSSALAPMLAEPLGTERWPEACVFFRTSTGEQ